MKGLPVVLMEAMAVGLPVVSTRHAGIPESLEDGVTGSLAYEGDSAGLAEHLRHLLAAPETWATLARRARAKVEAEHDMARQVQKLAELYRQLPESNHELSQREQPENKLSRPDRWISRQFHGDRHDEAEKRRG